MIDYNQENMEEMAEQLRLGCQQTRTAMIEGYMPLVVSKVSKWVSIYPSLKHLFTDMVSEGYVAVVKSVDAIGQGETPENSNVTAYVVTAIVNTVGEFLSDKDLIRVPRTSTETSPTIEQLFETSLIHSNTSPTLDTEDMIAASCQTDQDRAVVDLLSRGYTEREIASQLDISQTTVHFLRIEIHERFTQLERC